MSSQKKLARETTQKNKDLSSGIDGLEFEAEENRQR